MFASSCVTASFLLASVIDDAIFYFASSTNGATGFYFLNYCAMY